MNYTQYVQDLKDGKIVKFRPKGNSMTPKISSGQLITLTPFGSQELKKGDIVFCKVNGNYYVHLISAIRGDRYQISNNKGRINGWIGKNSLFGLVTKIEN